jgi:hypothetical protein
MPWVRTKRKSKNRRKSFDARLDLIEKYIREVAHPLGREELAADAIKLIAVTRRAIDAKHFDTALFAYHEVEVLYDEVRSEEKDLEDEIDREPKIRGGKKHRSHHEKERPCALEYIERRLRDDPPSLRDQAKYNAQLNKDTAEEVQKVTGTTVTVGAVQRWRRDEAKLKIAKMEAERNEEFWREAEKQAEVERVKNLRLRTER